MGDTTRYRSHSTKRKSKANIISPLRTDLLPHKPQKWQVECALKLLQTNQEKLILFTLSPHPPSPKKKPAERLPSTMCELFALVWVILTGAERKVYLWEIHIEDSKMLVSVT